MKEASVRDLRYNFAKVGSMLENGEEILITRRRRVIARMLPAEPNAHSTLPDFAARLHRYGAKTLEISGADLLRKDRDRL
jgi:antitoxin (DNA-binding transcriptional repressor) of toxin-antitoxin stability system